jgi:integrase
MKNKRKYFDLFDVPSLHLPGGYTPVLIINGEISIFALFYARELQRAGYSNLTIENKLGSIGRLWDYYLSTPTYLHNKDFLNSFCEARIHGTVQFDGTDVTGLAWSPPKYKTAIRDFKHVRKYLDFVSDHFNVIPLNPKEELSKKTFEYARQNERSKKYSLFYFLTENKNSFEIRNTRIDRYAHSNNNNTQYKFFPPTKIKDLINVMDTLRDKMIILLLAFGGIRVSELLHIHILDITKDKDGVARVALVNPVEGQQVWNVVKDGKVVRRKGTRRQFLSEEYGLLPRNLISTKDGLYLGWKGMLEDNSSTHVSYVYWIDKEAGQSFFKLHEKYIIERAKYNAEHPYYFVSQRGNTKGKPWRVTSLNNHLVNKFKQIGLDSSATDVSRHSLRHYYGYYAANILGLDINIVKEMIHHARVSSTECYYKLTNETIRKEIEKGYNSLKNKEDQIFSIKL